MGVIALIRRHIALRHAITVRQAAARLDVAPWMINRLVADCRLRPIADKPLRFTVKEVESYGKRMHANAKAVQRLRMLLEEEEERYGRRSFVRMTGRMSCRISM